MSAAESLLLFNSPLTEERLELDLPLEERVDFQKVKTELSVPEWVDSHDLSDVAAALWDCEPGSPSFPLDPLIDRTSRDRGLSKSVVLNLRNDRTVRLTLERQGASAEIVAAVASWTAEVGGQVESARPKEPRMKLKRLWREEVDPIE